MDYIGSSEVAVSFIANGALKSRLPTGELLLRGILSGAWISRRPDRLD
jgi:hypothetical protein